MDATHTTSEKKQLERYLTPLSTWALALGTIVGWGAFVMPGNTFLPLAGPLGSMLGIILGGLAMLVIGANYHYLMNRYPGSGGAFSFAARCFDYDQGFLCAWFLLITYTALFWANATALPLIARAVLGDFFQVGPLYAIAGYQVYLGEVALALAAMIASFLLCLKGRVSSAVQVVMALFLLGSVLTCYLVVTHGGIDAPNIVGNEPFGGRSPIRSIFSMIALAPWAFVGFESISHSESEFSFTPKRSLSCMLGAIIVGSLLYVLLTIMAASTQPAGYDGWLGYLSDLGSKSGVEGVPTFYAVWAAMGSQGITLLGLAAFCAIFTSLIGNMTAASRLMYAMAEERIAPSWFGKVGNTGAPTNALLFVLLVSLPIPLFGRTAISWLVDITTVGIVVAYAYTSVGAFKTAKKARDAKYTLTGALGIAISAICLLVELVPSILSVTVLSVESYLILTAWSILGLMRFHHIMREDAEHRMGRSTITLIVLLMVIIFTSLTWVRQSTSTIIDQSASNLHTRLEQIGTYEGSSDDTLRSHAIVSQQAKDIQRSIFLSTSVQALLTVVALVYVFRIYGLMLRREKQMEVEKVLAEESSRAKTSFLSNMSHEIRTPMNAIIGLDNIALKDPNLTPRTRDQLEKIGSSAQHLLGLINDILDMSRIESGRMVLKQEDFGFRAFLDQINVMINGQCQDKGLNYVCQVAGRTDDYYVGDSIKLKQVLINILGNAVKFTDVGGTVTLEVEQVGSFEGHRTLRFVISDTGIGMDEEYLPKIFEAFSQEDTATTNRYGGSGLGMAITKNIVEMMNGEIGVTSKKGVGTTFTVTVTLRSSSLSLRNDDDVRKLDSLRALIVDDDDVACEHAQIIMNDLGIHSERCTNSSDALALLNNAYDMGMPYHILLTDYLMPGMDGDELIEAVRAYDGGSTIIIVLTGYSVDDVTDSVMKAGADSLLSKPLFSDTLAQAIRSAQQQHEKEGIVERTVEDEPKEAVGTYIEGSLEGRRILLAEDIQINADIMMDLLDMEGMEVEHALNGRLALEMFEQSEPDHFDAIVMDVRMPEMDGLTAARCIRELSRPDAKQIPIIALTANAFDEDVQRSLQAGMNAHLSKPVEPDRLYDTLDNLIAARKLKAQSQKDDAS